MFGLIIGWMLVGVFSQGFMDIGMLLNKSILGHYLSDWGESLSFVVHYR